MRRIAIVGAECVGKTELAGLLAGRLPGRWIPEYLREFCDRLQRTPTQDEQWHIVAEQKRREDDAVEAARAAGLGWVLADSAPLLTAVYSELVFADVSLYAPAIEHHRRYDATLLLLPDLPWVADGIQRDGPGVREAAHALLLQRLVEADIACARIGGAGALRLDAALAALRDL